MPRFANVALYPAEPASGWRRISLGSWRPTGDSSIHASLDLDVEPLERAVPGVRLTHVVAAGLGRVLSEHPAYNSVVRFGRIHRRRSVDVFFHVLRSKAAQEDLTGVVVRGCERKSLDEIGAELDTAAAEARATDPGMGPLKRRFRWLPGFLSRRLLDLYGWLAYTLNLDARWLGSPRDAFGGVMVTNLGSLGIEQAFVPIAPYTRIGLVVAIGRVTVRPRVVDGVVVPRRSVTLSFTFDHRLGDGAHMAAVLAGMSDVFARPGLIKEQEPCPTTTVALAS